LREKNAFHFASEDQTAIKDEPTVRQSCTFSQKKLAPLCSTVVPLKSCSRQSEQFYCC